MTTKLLTLMDKEKLDEEIQLWKRCINNEKGAWDDFDERYRELIWWVINRMLPGHHAGFDKDDIFQEACIKIWKNLSKWRKEASLATYIKKITHRVTVDYMRKHRRAIVVGSKDVVSIYHKNQKTLADNRAVSKFIESKIHVDEILSSRVFSEKEALVARLCFCEGRHPEEVAEQLGVSVGAIHTMESRVRSKFKKIRKKILSGENL